MTGAAAPHDATLLPYCDLAALAGELLERIRSGRPRVHAITNAAAQTLTANLLLAVGAVPSLTVAPAEVPDFTRRSAALLVNLGTLDDDRLSAIPLAIAEARANGTPWVLDPVFADASSKRLAFARSCLPEGPQILRCNAGEFAALSGIEGGAESLRAFAVTHGTVVALTGEIDRIVDATRVACIGNGHVLMSRVTAMGCAGTALAAAFAAFHGDAFEAAAAALLVTGVAGEIAAFRSAGPGTFQVAYLDALYSLDRATLIETGRFS
jgi:hydroxyethylthiazole kinase